MYVFIDWVIGTLSTSLGFHPCNSIIENNKYKNKLEQFYFYENFTDYINKRFL